MQRVASLQRQQQQQQQQPGPHSTAAPSDGTQRNRMQARANRQAQLLAELRPVPLEPPRGPPQAADGSAIPKAAAAPPTAKAAAPTTTAANQAANIPVPMDDGAQTPRGSNREREPTGETPDARRPRNA
eukprot:1518360-Amphidinium_carterae.1